MTRIAALDDYQGDVLSLEEPLPADHPLRGLDNIVLTPHRGHVTREAYRGFFTGVVESIDRYLRGEVPARCLDPEARETRS